MKDIYFNLLHYLKEIGFDPIQQNVSIGIKLNGLHVDLIPAVGQGGNSYYHTIYRSRADTWTQTNIHKHINLVKDSDRLNEIKLTKIWTKLHYLIFPSFYVEMVILSNALYDKPKHDLVNNVFSVLEFLATKFVDARVVDPSNTNNIISDDLTNNERSIIANAANNSLHQASWDRIVW